VLVAPSTMYFWNARELKPVSLETHTHTPEGREANHVTDLRHVARVVIRHPHQADRSTEVLGEPCRCLSTSTPNTPRSKWSRFTCCCRRCHLCFWWGGCWPTSFPSSMAVTWSDQMVTVRRLLASARSPSSASFLSTCPTQHKRCP